MSQIILPKAWHVPEKEITPEKVFNNRRHFLKLMGFTAAGIAGALLAPPAFAQSAGGKLAERLFGSNLNSAAFRRALLSVAPTDAESDLLDAPAPPVMSPYSTQSLMGSESNFFAMCAPLAPYKWSGQKLG